MAITQKQLEQRRKNIGASDVAAILGVDPFRSAYDVWAQKTGRIENAIENGAMRVGKIMEVSALLFAEDRLGKIIRNKRYVLNKWPILASNTDGVLRLTGEPVEAKTTNIIGRASELNQWGDEGTDQCPNRVILQAMAQMATCESDTCYIAAIIGGRGFVLYKIRFDAELFNVVLEKLIRFWEYNVIKDIAPDGSLPSMETISKMKRIPEKSVPIDAGEVGCWLEAKAQKKLAEQAEENAKARLIASLGDAEEGYYDGGAVTYFQQTRNSFDVDSFSKDYPDLAKNYVKKTVYRVPRHKKLLLPENTNE